jgi:hypothetical protein
LDHAQFMWAGAERRILCNDDPFAVCIGLILDLWQPTPAARHTTAEAQS